MSAGYDGEGSGFSLTPGADRDLLRRLHRWDRDREREVAQRIEPFDGGVAVLSPDLDQLWIANLLEIESPEPGVDELASLADDLLGGNGMQHRLIIPTDPDHGDRLAEGFEESGWLVDRNLFLVYRREPEREGAPAVEVSRDRIASLRLQLSRQDPDFSPGAAEHMLLHDARLDEVANGRWFAALEDGEPAATCVLFESDGIGQVETVITRSESRGRGLASGVVLAAVAASKEAGHELTFLVADGDDWPWRLYERLGFERVGIAPAFLRKPPGTR